MEAKKRKVFPERGHGQLILAHQSSKRKGPGDPNKEQSAWGCGATDMGLREKLEGKQGQERPFETMGEMTAYLYTFTC